MLNYCKIQVKTEIKTFCEERLSFIETEVVFLHIVISAD